MDFGFFRLHAGLFFARSRFSSACFSRRNRSVESVPFAAFDSEFSLLKRFQGLEFLLKYPVVSVNGVSSVRTIIIRKFVRTKRKLADPLNSAAGDWATLSL